MLWPGIVATLLQGLQASHPLVRRNAAVACGVVYTVAIGRSMHRFMYDVYLSECQMAAAVREHIEGVATVQGLCDLLDDPNKGVRLLAIYSLAAMQAGEAVAPLLVTLHDPDQEVRWQGASSLRWFNNDRSVVLGLIEALRDPIQEIRLAAIESLSESDDLLAAQGLCDAMRDPDDSIRYFALCAPAMRRAPGAVTQLLVTLRDPVSYDIRQESAHAIGLIGEPAVAEELLAALGCERISEVRRSICWALGEIVAATAKTAQSAAAAAESVLKAVVPAMRTVCDQDSSVIVRVQAIQVLEGLGAEYDVEPNAETGCLSDPLPLSDKKLVRRANEWRKQLDTFCLVGEILKEDRKGTFVIAWMTEQLRERKNLRISESTLRDHLKAVKKFFRVHLPIPGDIWESSQGHRGYEITPQWWTAWRIAMQTLSRKMP